MRFEPAPVGRVIWIRWVLVNSGAWVIGFVAGCDFGGPVVGGAVFGASVATGQWLVLRQLFAWPKRWVFAGILVGTVAAAISFSARYFVDTGPAVIGVVIGSAVGIGHWFVLRRHLARASGWVLANTVGMGGGMVVGFTVSCTVPSLAGAMGGAAAGAITGIALVWLLQQPIQQA
jgi:hypothetical protein